MPKQRITLKLPSLNSIDTDNLILQKDQIQIPASVYLSRQDRLTIIKDEIPKELIEYFENIYQFRIQWRSSESSKSDELFQNYAIRGLEINIIPSILEYEPILFKFNEYFSKFLPFSVSPEEFISTATSATYHSFFADDSITGARLQKLIAQFIPEEQLDQINHNITDLDIIWSTEGDGKLEIKWISTPHDIILTPSDIKKEVGIFQSRKFDQEDIELTGLTLSIQNMERFVEPSNTLLIVKTRHQTLTESLDFQFESPIGLHPTLQIKGLSDVVKPYENCELFMYSNLENSLIFDKFQYDTRTLQLINSWGENDLELPKYAVKRYGSIQLFQILNYHDFEIKYHSRYLPLKDSHGLDKEQFKFLTPSIFWACDAALNIKDPELLSQNPFDSYDLGYESFFEQSTNFYHLQNNQNVLNYDIPKGNVDDFEKVQLITFTAVIFGSLFLLLKMFKSLTRTTTAEKDKKEK